MSQITLTSQQQSALDAFFSFLADPDEPVFVLRGYSGTGKSTLVKTMLDQMSDRVKAIQLLMPKFREKDVVLTATTNKAAENLSFLSGQGVSTIHSHLGLRVETDYRSGKTTMVPTRRKTMPENQIIFVDEASYVDSQLLGFVFELTKDCKIVFIGDPAQLTPVKSTTAPVFAANFPGAELTQVVRQAEGNPIIDLATKFRHTVNTGEFFSFKPDGAVVSHVSREDFDAAILAEFNKPSWTFRESKVLGWTNACVIGYNKGINNVVKGNPHLDVGDYAVCNSFLSVGTKSIKTDQTVFITKMGPEWDNCGVAGFDVELDHSVRVFLPKDRAQKQARMKQAKAEGNFNLVRIIDSEWADLRSAYASTINKAQGSTYDRVFIDLDDIGKCNSGDQIARMMYVGVSRARHQVILTGDLV